MVGKVRSVMLADLSCYICPPSDPPNYGILVTVPKLNDVVTL